MILNFIGLLIARDDDDVLNRRPPEGLPFQKVRKLLYFI
jgi:hypothetical protein